MAYMNQERKQALSPAIKKVMTKYGLKGTISVRHHSTLIVNIKQGKLDIIQNYNDVGSKKVSTMRNNPVKDYIQVNQYWLDDYYSGEVLNCLKALVNAMNNGNHYNSDIQSDYHDVGWYIQINVGQYDKPYQVI